MKAIRITGTILIIGIFFFSSAGWAGSLEGIHSMLSDRVVIGAGMFWSVNNDSKLRLDKTASELGTEIGLEDDLDMDESTISGLAFLNWRITNRLRLQLEYFNIDREGSRSIGKDINWGRLAFSSRAAVNSELDMDVGRLFVGYSFIKDQKKELGIGVGAHVVNLEATISGAASISGVFDANASESADGWVGFPNVGIYGGYAINEKWYIGGQVNAFSMGIGDYDGTLWNAMAYGQFQIADHIGVLFGYNYMDISVDIDMDDWIGEVDFTFHGPIVMLTVNFF